MKMIEQWWTEPDVGDQSMEDEHGEFWERVASQTFDVSLTDKILLDFGYNQGGFLRKLYDEHKFRQAVGVDLARVICVDGSKYDFSDCDLVFVSNWIADKQPLLRPLRKFTNNQHLIFRSAPRNSLGFIINDMIDPNRVCEHGFRFRHQTEKRPGLSLISLIFSLLRQSEATESTETICRADDEPAEIATI